MKLISKLNLYFIILSLGMYSCEDVINVDIPEGETLLVVDGWITDQSGPYIITLSTTDRYFSNSEAPKVTGAIVRISDSEGNTEVLQETALGIYETQSIQGKIGNSYTLEIEYDGESYKSDTYLSPTSPIDSLTYRYEEANLVREDPGIFASYYGPELPEEGNFYRMKVYVNNVLENKTEDLLLFDDKFTNGNYFNDYELEDTPLTEGDNLRVEFWSLTEDTYLFYEEMLGQIDNTGLFANPIANIRTNIINNNPNSKRVAVGYFGASSVSSKSGIIIGQEGVIK